MSDVTRYGFEDRVWDTVSLERLGDVRQVQQLFIGHTPWFLSKRAALSPERTE